MSKLPWDTRDDDAIRRHIAPTDYTYVNGLLCLKPRGLVTLCERVIDGTLTGNADNARIMRDLIAAEFPDSTRQP